MRCAAACAALLLSAAPANAALSLADLRAHVSYVFVIVQDGRSFDSTFGTFPGAEGPFSNSPAETPGFVQTLTDADGSTVTVTPFRIGPEQHAADTDAPDDSAAAVEAKMHVADSAAAMDRFAAVEQARRAAAPASRAAAKQFGELTMAYEDCDTVPILWYLAQRFVLFDHIFSSGAGPSTLGNLALLGAQTGQTQLALHPELASAGAASAWGLPVRSDADPHWGSPLDVSAQPRLPANPSEFPGAAVQENLTFATLPLTLAGEALARIAADDSDSAYDLIDTFGDVRAIVADGAPRVPWGWYQEGYDLEPTDRGAGRAAHASYVMHDGGPQYFGYVAANPRERANLHGLQDFFDALSAGSLPEGGGLYYVSGGLRNIFELRPSFSDPAVQQKFLGDDDQPGRADAQISEALVGQAVDAIVRSKYWSRSAIIITWNSSGGLYDHVPPPQRSFGAGGSIAGDGPRVPLLLLSPYAKTGVIDHTIGTHGSVVKFADELFGRTALADLPDERGARDAGLRKFRRLDMGPDDGPASGTSDLLGAFDPDRLAGRTPPLDAEYAAIDDRWISYLPAQTDLGCETLGIVPVDRARGVSTAIPRDFNPRPATDAR